MKLGKQLVVGGEVANEILTVYLFRCGKNMPMSLVRAVSLKNKNVGALVSVTCFTQLFALRNATSLLKTRFSYGA